MIERKIPNALIIAILTVLLFSSLLASLQVNSKLNNFIETPLEWFYGEEYMDPVTIKINEYKANGLTDEQITVELEKLGMGWYPKTGATWMQDDQQPTLEEIKSLQPLQNPFSSAKREQEQANEVFGVGNPQTASYTGMYNTMYPGTLPVDTDETFQHVVTTHLGKEIDEDTPCWTEVGVVAWNASTYVYYFVYDVDEGGWHFYGTKSSMQSADTYGILLDGTYDDDGWHYDIWINQNWKFSGHLAFELNQGDVANEIWTDTGTWTADSGCCFSNCFTADNSYNWINWGTNLGFSSIHYYPTMWYSVNQVAGRYVFQSGTN